VFPHQFLAYLFFSFFFARFSLTSSSFHESDIFCVKITPYLNYLFLIVLISACIIGSPSGNSMPVQEPETVKVKLEYKSAKIAKEVKKRS
jgi:hypothetical protein